MIPGIDSSFRRPTMTQVVLFALLALCATVDLPRNVSFAGTTLLGASTLAGCGIIWAVFLVRPVIPNHLLKSVLFLIFFEIYSAATMLWSHTGVDGVQMLVIGFAFLGLILVCARETADNPDNAQALQRALLTTSAVPFCLYFVVIYQEQKLGDGVEGIVSNRAFALYAIVVVAVALSRWRATHAKKMRGLIPLAWACFVTLAVALSMSRTALVCCLMLFPLAIFLRLDKKSIALSLIILIGGGVLFGVAIMSYQPLYDRFFAYDTSIKVGGMSINASGRTRIWQLLLNSIGDNWIFGCGVASSQICVRNGTHGLVGQPHNDYLRYYYDTGAFGLFLWFCFFYSFVTRTSANLWRSIRNQSCDYPLHVGALLAFFAVSWSMLTDNSVVYSFVMMPLGIVIGCSLGAAKPPVALLPEEDADCMFQPVQPLRSNVRMV